MSDRPDIAALEAELRELEERRVALLQSESRRLHGEHAISRERGWFWAFFQWAWPLVEPKAPLMRLPATRLICQEVERWLEREPGYQMQLVEVPPGVAKSMTGLTMAPAARWLHEPWMRFACFAGTQKVNSENSHRCRLILQSEEYQALADRAAELHGHEPWRLAVGANQALDYENTPHRGQRFARPFKGDVTGVRGDYLIGDDLMQASVWSQADPAKIDADSEQAWNRFNESISTRVADENKSPILLINQGLGVGDFGERWRKDEPALSVLKLAMEYDPDDEENHPDDWRTERGELLCPELKGPDAVARKKRGMRAEAYEAQYNQRRINPQGALFTSAMYRTYQGAPRRGLGMYRLMSVDCAFKEGPRTDEVAIGVLEVRGHRRYWLDVMASRADIVRTMEMMEEMYRRWEPHTCVVEDKANGPAVIRLMRDKIPRLLPYSPEDSKPVRLGVLATAMRQSEQDGHPHYFPEDRHAPWMAQVRQQCANAPNRKPVDIPDMMAQAELVLQANPWMGKVDAGDVGVW